MGPENYYLEIQDHGLPDQQKINRGVLELSKQMGIPVIATNDVHYVRQEHAHAQEILLCVQTNTTMDDPNRMRMETQNFYLRSPEEMARVFSEVPEALRNTLRVAEQCNLSLDFNRVILPELDFIPQGMAPDEYLAKLARKGMEERYPRITDEVQSRLEYELSVIEKTGFAKYILLVYDYVNWARKTGHLRPAERLGRRQHGPLLPVRGRRGPDGVRPHLRALPESRAGSDARRGHGLPGRPPGRGDRLRHSQVRL